MRWLLLIAVLASLSGCGSDDSATADEVERAVEAVVEMPTPKVGGRPVDLTGGPVKLVRCKEASGRDNTWECTATRTTGKNVFCTVDDDPPTGKERKISCAPVDY